MKFVIILLLVIVTAGPAQEQRRPKIGLVLSGGVALGLAHVGALRVIDSLGIPIDYIVGTSFGGIVGALYSINYRSDSLLTMAKEIDWNDLFDDSPSRNYLPYVEKRYSGRYHIRLPLDGFTPTPPSGAIAGQKISLLLNRLTDRYAEVMDFDSLPIPFRCVGVDLITGNEVTMNRGPLPRALRATMSIPTAFAPVEYGDSLISDGGLLNNYPVDVLKSMGAEFIIGVNVSSNTFSRDDAKELFKVLDRATSIPRYQKMAELVSQTDIYIQPQLQGYGMTDFDRESVQQIIEQGYRAALLHVNSLAALKERIGAEPMNVRPVNPPPFLSEEFTVYGVTITGNEKLDFQFIFSLLGIEAGSTCSRDILEHQINELYALGYFETINYSIIPKDSNNADITIIVKEKPFRELNIGFRYDDFYQLVGIVGVRSTNTILSGVRFESEMEFAGLFRAWAKLSYPSRSLDQPVYPFLTARYKDLPLNFFYPASTEMFKDRSLAVGAGIGFTVAKTWSTELEFDDETTNLLPLTNVNDPKLTDRLRYMLLNTRLDDIDDVLLPRRGTRISAQLEQSNTAFGSDFNYTRISIDADHYFSPSPLHTLRFRGMFMKVYDTPPLYKQFVFGGPQDFAGADYQGIFGSKFIVLRGEYRYEYKRDIFFKWTANILVDPDILNPINNVITEPKFGAGFGVMFTSILGPVDIMLSYGDRSYQSTKTKTFSFHFSAGMMF